MLKIILVLVIAYSLMCAFLYAKQRDMLFYPVAESNDVPADVLWLESDSARLKIWRFNEGDEAIIYFGGNAEAVHYNIADFKPLLAGFTVYLVNYRGYGGSSGQPSQQALFEDALTVYDHLKARHSRIHVIGRSLGSGVACYLASQRSVDKLVFITPFDSVKNIAQSHYPLFPVKWLIKDPFDCQARAGSLSNPVLLLVAENDRVVPFKNSQNLVQALTHARVEQHIIRRATHNDITDYTESLDYLAHFLTGTE